MPSAAEYIIGGALKGLGRGAIDIANQQREDALARAQQLAKDRALQEERNYQEGREQNRRAYEGSLIADTQVDENGNVIGLTKSGKTIKTGIRKAVAAGEGGLTAGEKRLLDAAIERNTTRGLEGETVAWNRVARDLEQQGYPKLASLARGSQGGVAATIDTNSAEWSEAQRMADQRINELTTVMGKDKSELAQWGGSRTEARLALTRQYYAQLTGGQGGEPGTPSSALGQPTEPQVAPTEAPVSTANAGTTTTAKRPEWAKGESYGKGYQGLEPGFKRDFQDANGNKITLRAAMDGEVYQVGSVTGQPVNSPAPAAQQEEPNQWTEADTNALPPMKGPKRRGLQGVREAQPLHLRMPPPTQPKNAGRVSQAQVSANRVKAALAAGQGPQRRDIQVLMDSSLDLSNLGLSQSDIEIIRRYGKDL